LNTLLVAGVIVAAGKSTRMGGLDKQFYRLLDVPMLAWSIAAFQANTMIQKIVLVVRKDQIPAAQTLVEQYSFDKVSAICPGGERRQDSVYLGLQAVGQADWVVIHDAARPMVTPALISEGIEAARVTGAAVAAVPVKDTIKLVGTDNVVRSTLDRSSLWAAQTPQVFDFGLIRQACLAVAASGKEFTDEAAMMEAIGHQVRIYPGDHENLKITTQVDTIIASALLEARRRRD
jgi:2-C-methyl-D-erythritol 4-phosphate cytidylyltransferase